jgi:hypothetical protein
MSGSLDLQASLARIRRERRASSIVGEDQCLVPVDAIDGLLTAAGAGAGFDLSMRCREIVQWRRTGRYGGTELQRMADTLPDQSEEDPPLARAELLTIREALQFAAAFYPTDEDAEEPPSER